MRRGALHLRGLPQDHSLRPQGRAALQRAWLGPLGLKRLCLLAETMRWAVATVTSTCFSPGPLLAVSRPGAYSGPGGEGRWVPAPGNHRAQMTDPALDSMWVSPWSRPGGDTFGEPGVPGVTLSTQAPGLPMLKNHPQAASRG